MLTNVQLFNPNGDDTKANRQVWGGDNTGVIQLNNIRFSKMKSLYDLMLNNFWRPEKFDLTEDKRQFPKLSEKERFAFDGTLCYLTFLDSIQVRNLPLLSQQITAPEVTITLCQHAFQETIHASSYQYIIESLYPPDERNDIYYFYKRDSTLLERMLYITGIYQNYINEGKGEDDLYFRALIANFLLEGLYFYTGFLFFYSLAEKSLMLGCSDIIRLINRDELTHVQVFGFLINSFEKSNLDGVIEMARQTTNMEIEWGKHIYEGITVFTPAKLEQYCKNRANKLFRSAALPVPFEGVASENPYHRLELMSDTSSSYTLKGNFFEGGVTNYTTSSGVTGWDSI